MERPGRPRTGGAWLREREGTFTTLYALGVLLLLLSVGVTPIRERVLYRLQIGSRAVEGHWLGRLAEAEGLVAEGGRGVEAVRALERLDRVFPALISRGALDQERERLFRALALAYEQAHRDGAALRTWQRLVAYDPRNYRNYVALGDAYRRLRGSWTVPVEARDAYAEALAIDPTHLPSLREVIRYDFDRGDFAAVIARWETSLDALPVLRLRVGFGEVLGWDGEPMLATIPVDGHVHTVEIPLGTEASDTLLTLRTSGLPGRWLDLELAGPLTAGVAGPRRTVRLDGPGALPAGVDEVGLPLGGHGTDVTLLRLRVQIARPMDRDTWTMITKSYRNRLDLAGLAASEARVVVLPDAALADRLEVPWP